MGVVGAEGAKTPLLEVQLTKLEEGMKMEQDAKVNGSGAGMLAVPTGQLMESKPAVMNAAAGGVGAQMKGRKRGRDEDDDVDEGKENEVRGGKRVLRGDVAVKSEEVR